MTPTPSVRKRCHPERAIYKATGSNKAQAPKCTTSSTTSFLLISANELTIKREQQNTGSQEGQSIRFALPNGWKK